MGEIVVDIIMMLMYKWWPMKLKCKRPQCRHQWIGRMEKPPQRCPRCGSPKWNQSAKKAA